MADETIQISVIIPTFNRANMIGRAIRSVLAQDFSSIEIIVVDDASSDNTEEIINAFADNQIRYIRLSQNGGVSKARNRGVQEAKGDLIAFLDSDDEWLMDMLSEQLSVFESNPDCDAVIAGFIRYYNGIPCYISASRLQSLYSSKDLISIILRDNFVSAQTLMLKKDCFISLGGFDESLTHYEDRDFGLRLLQNFNVKVLDIPLAVIYETPGNLTSMCLAKTEAFEKFINKHYQSIAHYQSVLTQYYWFIGHSYMLVGNDEKGCNYFKTSIKNSFTFKSLASYLLSLFGSSFYRAILRLKKL